MVLLVELYCEVKLLIVFLCSCLCVEKLIKNTIIETYCLRHCRQDTPKRVVHAKGGAVSINTKVKSEDTEITDSRNHRQNEQTHRTAYQDAGAYRHSGENVNNKNKRILSGWPKERVLMGAQTRKNKPKQNNLSRDG